MWFCDSSHNMNHTGRCASASKVALGVHADVQHAGYVDILAAHGVVHDMFSHPIGSTAGVKFWAAAPDIRVFLYERKSLVGQSGVLVLLLLAPGLQGIEQ